MVLALVLGTVAFACDSSEVLGWKLDRARVLGARASADADPARATLAPGERGTLTWLVVGPTPPVRRGWAFAACVPPAGLLADPACAAPAIAFGSGESSDESVPMPLSIPPVEATGDATELLVLAAFCDGGAPALDARAFAATCPSGAPLLASTKVRLARAGANQNPALEGASFRVDAAPWSVATTCDGAASIGAGQKVPLRVTLPSSLRETTADGPEALVLSSFVDQGTLDRQFSAVDPGDSGDVAIDYTAPAQVGARASFVFVLRDGRGGTSFARRVLCVR
jgi:hypothetical protein